MSFLKIVQHSQESVVFSSLNSKFKQYMQINASTINKLHVFKETKLGFPLIGNALTA